LCHISPSTTFSLDLCSSPFYTAPPPSEIYTLSLHDALPIFGEGLALAAQRRLGRREPLAKPLPRDTQRVLRVQLHRTGQRNDREPHVADLSECPPAVSRLGQLLLLPRQRLSRRRRPAEPEPHPPRAPPAPAPPRH